jgi:hypothetical protein
MGHVIAKNLDWVEYKIYIRYERNLEERFFFDGRRRRYIYPRERFHDLPSLSYFV